MTKKNPIFILNRFKKSGGRVEVWHVKSLAQLAPEYNVVFNCTGLGAADLCSDMHVIPIRGQVIKVRIRILHG